MVASGFSYFVRMTGATDLAIVSRAAPCDKWCSVLARFKSSQGILYYSSVVLGLVSHDTDCDSNSALSIGGHNGCPIWPIELNWNLTLNLDLNALPTVTTSIPFPLHNGSSYSVVLDVLNSIKFDDDTPRHAQRSKYLRASLTALGRTLVVSVNITSSS
jgi:hypothetical protein